METTTVKLYSLDYSNVKTYWAASLFIIGNILFPQLFHLIPQGGITWLPIYFFTLIGAYKYGWKVGLLTAVLSLAINSLLFSMPGSRHITCNFIEIRIIGYCCRMDSATLQTYFCHNADRGSICLSGSRYIRRMDIHW